MVFPIDRNILIFYATIYAIRMPRIECFATEIAAVEQQHQDICSGMVRFSFGLSFGITSLCDKVKRLPYVYIKYIKFYSQNELVSLFFSLAFFSIIIPFYLMIQPKKQHSTLSNIKSASK